MMARIVYYLIVLPLSMLPLGIIYLLSDLLYFFLTRIFKYRRKVVESALKRSFPEKSDDEIRKLSHQFYRHLSDVFGEAIKNLSISENELRKRLVVENPEVIEKLYLQKRSVLLVSGHYNNWEWVISSLNLLFSHQAVGIGMPLSNPFWDKKVNERRARFGIVITEAKEVKDVFKKYADIPINTLILSDQSPHDARKSYWMNFLNQQTAVLFGCEQLAHQYNHAVVYYHLTKVKRGHYSMRLELITEDPSSCRWGEITERHTQLLERDILHQPEFWLWSHKRWKREIPKDLEQLKQEQKKKFEERFGVNE